VVVEPLGLVLEVPVELPPMLPLEPAEPAAVRGTMPAGHLVAAALGELLLMLLDGAVLLVELELLAELLGTQSLELLIELVPELLLGLVVELV
jgi:hypothetical protein